MIRKMPKQKPGQSNQVVATPPEFLDAVRRRFGTFGWDLAALASNAVTKCDRYFGPDHEIEGSRNSLGASWAVSIHLCWLNPPYDSIAKFAAKAHTESMQGARIAMLVPASIGSNWFAEHVHGKAYVLALSPRLTFVGEEHPYPKDLMLCVYGMGLHGFDCWKWDR